MKYIKKLKLNESKDSIIQALRDNNNELKNGELLSKSGYDFGDSNNVSDFYSDLKELEKQGKIKETSDKTRIRLIYDEDLVEPEEPVGKFILDNAKGVKGKDGTYYHYSVVCDLLKKYKES